MPFHEKLLEACRLYAPAHPGCAASDEIEYLESAEDLVFHYLEVIDALELERFDRGRGLRRGLGGGGAGRAAPGKGPPVGAHRRIGPVRARERPSATSS